MDQPIVRVENLSHRYSVNWAIRNISFEINKNGVLGLLGSNGAGKSTTMNIMCGVLNQTEGNVFIAGINLQEHPKEAKKYIGFLPQTPPLYPDFTVDEYLRHCAYLRRMHKHDIPPALEEAKDRCGISHFSKRLIKNLSGGYRQRVGIAQAIIHKPLLVIMDEPTNGLDPNQIHEVRALIKEIATDRAVIFSSHILSEIQATCQEVKMIEGGHMVFSDTIDAFNNYIIPNSLLVSLAAPPALSELKELPGIINAENAGNGMIRLSFSSGPDISEQVAAWSSEHGWRLKELIIERSSLDDVFARLSGKSS